MTTHEGSRIRSVPTTLAGAVTAVLVALAPVAVPGGASASPAAQSSRWTGTLTVRAHLDYRDDCEHDTGDATLTANVGGYVMASPADGVVAIDVEDGLDWPTASGSFHFGGCGDDDTFTFADYAPSGPGQGAILGDSYATPSTVDPDTGTVHYHLDALVNWYFNGHNSRGEHQQRWIGVTGDDVLSGDLSADATEWHTTGHIPADDEGMSYDLQLDLQQSCGLTSRVGEAVSAPVCSNPVADPGPQQTTTRAEQVSLDGSASTPSVGSSIVSWHWHLEPGPDCDGLALPATDFDGEVVGPFTVLCGLQATLTVTDTSGRESSPKTTDILVAPRPWPKLRVTSTPDSNGSDTKGLPEGFALMGLNVSNCFTLVDDAYQDLCPRLPESDSYYEAAAFHVTTVSDAGPFSGIVYVSDASFSVDVKGIVNRAYGPFGSPPVGMQQNLWTVNTDGQVADWRPFRTAVLHHENMGAPGRLDTGHAGLMELAVRNHPSTDDMNRVAEKMWGTSEEELIKSVDAAATAAQDDLSDRSADKHLKPLGSFDVFRWRPSTGLQFERCTVGGPRQGCEIIHDAHVTVRPHAVRRGHKVLVRAGVFRPGERVHLSIDRGSRTLGVFHADVTGHLSNRVKIPPHLAPGTHHLRLRGSGSNVHGSATIRVRR